MPAIFFYNYLSFNSIVKVSFKFVDTNIYNTHDLYMSGSRPFFLGSEEYLLAGGGGGPEACFHIFGNFTM